jgi:hypothetical protein
MKRKPKIKVLPGMVFGVPQKDSLLLVGQVLERPSDPLMSMVLFDHRVASADAADLPPLQTLRVLATATTFPDGIERSIWPVIKENEPLALPQSQWPNEHARAKQWVGRRVNNSLIIEDFVNACAGLIPWRSYAATPDYFDKMLFPGVQRPKEADLIGRPT